MPDCPATRNADGGSVNGNGDADEGKEEGTGDRSMPPVTMVLEGKASDDEEDSGLDAEIRPSADKTLLCKAMPVRSVTVEMIATEKGWKFSCETIGLGDRRWPPEPYKVAFIRRATLVAMAPSIRLASRAQW